MWYGPNQENAYAPGNAAPFAINSAIIQTLSGERFMPKTLFLVFIGIIPIVLISYLFIRELYDEETGFVAAFFMIFSLKNILAHIMGQRLDIFSIVFIPAVLFCYYKYTNGFLVNQPKPIYLIMATVLVAMGGIFHPQMMGTTAVTLFFYTAFLTIKYKKLPFSIKLATLCIVMAIAIILPFAPDWFTQETADPGHLKLNSLSMLFTWYPAGPSFDMVGGWWLIVLLIIGIAFLLMNHNDNDVILLCWLAGLYCVLHLGFIGIYEGRVNRFLYGTAHIVYPIAVVSCYYIAKLINKACVKYVLYALLLALIILTNGVQAYGYLSTAYSPIMRMTDMQYDAAQWIDRNLPEDAVVYSIGSLTYPKQRWVNMLSHRYFEVNHPQEDNGTLYPGSTHVLVDFSDFMLIGSKENVDALNEWISHYNLSDIIYDQGGIRIYER